MTFVGPINYILKSADAFKKLFILIVFSIFVITSPAVAGYCIKSIRAIRDGSDELPNLEFALELTNDLSPVAELDSYCSLIGRYDIWKRRRFFLRFSYHDGSWIT